MGEVIPPTGTTETEFTYIIYYKDLDNNPPAEIFVAIDGHPFNMSLRHSHDAPDGELTTEEIDYSRGQTYEFTLSGMLLGIGDNHTYRFYAHDGINPAVGDIQAHTGPEVINRPPIAVAGVSRKVKVNEEVTFDASASYDPDADAGAGGIIVKYEWDFGDGSPHAMGVIVTHTYTKPGEYTVILTVIDDLGATSAPQRITISVVPEEQIAPFVPTVIILAVTIPLSLGIGFIFYIVVYKKKRRLAQAGIEKMGVEEEVGLEVTRELMCPACGASLSMGTVICTRCGRDVREKFKKAVKKPVRRRYIEPERLEGLIKKRRVLKSNINCPACGTLVKAGESACPGCGEEEFGPGVEWEYKEIKYERDMVLGPEHPIDFRYKPTEYEDVSEEEKRKAEAERPVVVLRVKRKGAK
jgi:PKD repeat protein